jgi:hypothetical protein
MYPFKGGGGITEMFFRVPLKRFFTLEEDKAWRDGRLRSRATIVKGGVSEDKVRLFLAILRAGQPWLFLGGRTEFFDIQDIKETHESDGDPKN